jgi:hypothetical protein
MERSGSWPFVSVEAESDLRQEKKFNARVGRMSREGGFIIVRRVTAKS